MNGATAPQFRGLRSRALRWVVDDPARELEVIATVPGEEDEEEGYDGEGGNDGGYGGAYMGDVEEEGQYSTDPTQHPSMQMHMEIDDGRVAIILKNSILIL